MPTTAKSKLQEYLKILTGDSAETLTEIDLSGSGHDYDGVDDDSVDRDDIGDDEVIALVEVLITTGNTTLKKLDLGHNNIGPKGAEALAMTTLTHLELGHNHIGPKGAEALAMSPRPC